LECVHRRGTGLVDAHSLDDRSERGGNRRGSQCGEGCTRRHLRRHVSLPGLGQGESSKQGKKKKDFPHSSLEYGNLSVNETLSCMKNFFKKLFFFKHSNH
jgi:hypothetical protein